MSVIFLIISFILSALLMKMMIPKLKELKFGQSIRQEGPESHLAKTGTPTMGGISFIAVTTVLSLIALIFVEDISKLLILIIVTLGFGLIGFIDDYIIVVKKDNTGLTSKQKALAQVVVSIIVFFIMMKFVPSIELGVTVPGTDFTIHLGYLFILWIVFWLVGFSNAVNLTDGLDGLSTSTTIVANLSFLIIAWMSSENEIVIFLAILIGAQLGFLIFNKYPAKVFMGDTGSLALGGIVGIVSIMLNNSLLLLLIGIVFVVETASVIIQVISFKTTGKRIFKMTPIHHHFELSGWNEKKIVAVFSLVGAIAGVLGVLIGG
ncbi:phospho-N-acetylmuramoyl-pentapeptide-transferase [Nosocomiicoccus ampullae]|uniref:Phospho-N-acetylmuramoyl-pentapeptide-transferase n=1 Tax=Nosocomiicoccus ampullae TaxID=489910 RepID=A0A9Q2CZI3_9STAP|nr:phospho-N-acetylmuramoyl-pentapeptide-transferase [Nosocomiicoccus ampullae]MBB5176152.1 phospho-N-acetylmuramoyl-pentapeptide-transferase [Nosocomiicoccus ampullae]QYA47323.1 phospho-N-acetylmuramoyl-pentapeptide-transferase [Nosocomiicoccus ampullae]QYA48951.1 phospho-N-acetylmuramoyl-pentapeptide-transferase [Nosocomiicoccus ampullae]